MPLYLVELLAFYSALKYLTPLASSYLRVYRALRSALLVALFFGLIFLSTGSYYLDQKEEKNNKVTIAAVAVPYFVSLLTLVAIFVYLLPGLYDPENNIEKRVPFLIMLHFLNFFVSAAFITLNEAYLKHSNGILIYGTALFTFVMHLTTFMFEYKTKP